jgi:hypothetical protein
MDVRAPAVQSVSTRCSADCIVSNGPESDTRKVTEYTGPGLPLCRIGPVFAKKGDSDTTKEIAELTAKLDHRTLAIWATDCAEHVLAYFEEKYPKDNRPRKAVAAGRAWVRGEISVSEARSAAFAAHAAAQDADEGIARARWSRCCNGPRCWSRCSRC